MGVQWHGEGRGNTKNTCTTHFRTADTRIGKWWGVDPKATAWESPYARMGNNPILNIDPIGDTTWYYDNKGISLHVSFDKLDNAVTIIENEGIDGFKTFLENYKSTGEEHANRTNSVLRYHFGKSFRINDLIAFQSDKKDRVSDEYVSVNGNPLVNEKGANLRLNDANIYIIVPSTIAQGDPWGIDKNQLNLYRQHVHTHDNVNSCRYIPNTKNRTCFSDGVSNSDRNTAHKDSRVPDFNVVISDISIRFFRYNQEYFAGKRNYYEIRYFR